MIKDKYELTGFNSAKFPRLKGHIKLTLHNCRTGKNDIIEGDNIITNAVRDIFANNYLGGIDYSNSTALFNNGYKKMNDTNFVASSTVTQGNTVTIAGKNYFAASTHDLLPLD